jgi:hypothetical protein
MHKKTPIVKAYRQRNFDKGCCYYCGKPNPENDFRTSCEECRSKEKLRSAIRRQDSKDFK